MAPTTAVGAQGHGPLLKQRPEIGTAHRQPGDGIAEHRRDGAVVLRGTHEQRLMALQGVHQPFKPRTGVLLGGGGVVERQIEAAELDDLGADAIGLGGRGDLPGHRQVLPAAGCEDQHLRVGNRRARSGAPGCRGR